MKKLWHLLMKAKTELRSRLIVGNEMLRSALDDVSIPGI
jgi:hypothetical protein